MHMVHQLLVYHKYNVEFFDQRVNAQGQPGQSVGNARVYDFAKKSISGVGTDRHD